MKRTPATILLALSIVGASVAAQAQITPGVASHIDEARQRVVAARLGGHADLKRNGALSEAEMGKLNDGMKAALDVWSMCVNANIDGQVQSTLANEGVIDVATAACSRDRAEVIAWIDFIGQAHRNPAPAGFLANYLKEQDAMMRANALVRLKARRALAPR